MACGLEDYARTAELGNLLVGDGAAVYGNLDKVLLGSLNALGDGSLNFIGLSEAPAYDAVLITYDNDGGKCKGAEPLGHLGDTVDGNQTILEFEIVSGLYFIVLICHIFLEFKAAFACGVSQ